MIKYRNATLKDISGISELQQKYPILITFINHINPRSYHAHTKKLGLDVIKSFEFNNNQYYELGYDTSKKLL